MSEIKQEPEHPLKPPPATAPVVLDTRELFGGGKELWIEHAGVRYRLRITRRNRLILQK